MVLGGDNGPGFLGGLDDQLLVQGLPGEHVDHPDADPLGLEGLVGFQALVHHDAGGDDGGLVLIAFVEHHALADFKLRALVIDPNHVLADEAGEAHTLDIHQSLGDAGQLVVVGGVDHRGGGDAQVHGRVLQGHVGAAVEGRRHARVGAQHPDAQARVGGAHVDLVIAPAAGEGAEGVEENLLPRGGQARGHAGGVPLGDARLKGPVGVILDQLLGIDAAHQIAVYIHDALVLGHQLVQGQSQAVPAGPGILFMLANQFHIHFSHPPLSVLRGFQLFFGSGDGLQPLLLLGLGGVVVLGLRKRRALALAGS